MGIRGVDRRALDPSRRRRRTLARATHRGGLPGAAAPRPGSQPNGCGDRNIVPLYRSPNIRLTYHFVPHEKLRVSALRGLGAYGNVFAIESFMDELAAAAEIDPVQFRLKHLADARATDVVKLVAERFGWKADAKLSRGRGQGFAFARYKTLAAYCAVAVEARGRARDRPDRLIRAVSAVDSGKRSTRTASGTRSKVAFCSRRVGRSTRPLPSTARASAAGTGAATRSCASTRCPRAIDVPRSSTGRAAVPRHRRGEPGADRCGNRQRGSDCHRAAHPRAAADARPRQGGDRRLVKGAVLRVHPWDHHLGQIGRAGPGAELSAVGTNSPFKVDRRHVGSLR